MRLYEYQRSRSFTDLGQIQSDLILLNFISSVTAYFNIASALRLAIQDHWSSSYSDLCDFCVYSMVHRLNEEVIMRAGLFIYFV